MQITFAQWELANEILSRHPALSAVFELEAPDLGRPFFWIEFLRDPLGFEQHVRRVLDGRLDLDLFSKLVDVVQGAGEE